MAGGGGTNAYDQAARGMNAAGGKVLRTMRKSPATMANRNLDPYMNPFTDSVIDSTMGVMSQAHQQALNGVGADATAAGAFGGDRHGVMEGALGAQHAMNVGQMAANLNSQNFNQATALAGADADRVMAARGQQLGAAGQLAGMSQTGFNMANTINGQMMNNGLMAQAMRQAQIDAAKGQFDSYRGAPGQSLSYPLAALGASPKPQSTTQSTQPGLFNYLSLGLSAF